MAKIGENDEENARSGNHYTEKDQKRTECGKSSDKYSFLAQEMHHIGSKGFNLMTLLIGGAYQTVLIPGFFTLYANQILCDLIEETLAPYSKLVWILDKRQDILLGLIIVNRCKTGAEQVFQLDNIQRGSVSRKPDCRSRASKCFRLTGVVMER